MMWATALCMQRFIVKCADYVPKRLRAPLSPSQIGCSWHSQSTSLLSSPSTAVAPGRAQQPINSHLCKCFKHGGARIVDQNFLVKPVASFMPVRNVAQLQGLPQLRRQLKSSQHMPALAAFSTTTDTFTRALQQKTEQDVLNLVETARAAKLAAAAAAAESADDEAGADAADDDDTIDTINPETGEAYGPRGKEPTRYGDWEIKGRCTDFS